MGFPGGSVGKNPPAMQEIWVRFLGWEDLLEKRSEVEIYSLQYSGLENIFWTVF